MLCALPIAVWVDEPTGDSVATFSEWTRQECDDGLVLIGHCAARHLAELEHEASSRLRSVLDASPDSVRVGEGDLVVMLYEYGSRATWLATVLDHTARPMGRFSLDYEEATHRFGGLTPVADGRDDGGVELVVEFGDDP